MKTLNTRSTTLSYGTTVAELSRWLDTLPDSATLNVSVSKGDRPWESDTTNISASWSEDE